MFIHPLLLTVAALTLLFLLLYRLPPHASDEVAYATFCRARLTQALEATDTWGTVDDLVPLDGKPLQFAGADSAVNRMRLAAAADSECYLVATKPGDWWEIVQVSHVQVPVVGSAIWNRERLMSCTQTFTGQRSGNELEDWKTVALGVSC